jgi:NADH:ubiquinone oxidoreductase subunit 4 (subunit M)
VAAQDGLLALSQSGSSAALAGGFAAALAAFWAGLYALPQADLRRRLAGFSSAQGALWFALLALLEPALARPAVGGWALVTLVALVAIVMAYARLWEFTRTGDLRAYGGLGRVALVRSTLLLIAFAALLAAPFLGARGRGFRALLTLVLTSPLSGLAVALGGAFGALALGLAIYRTIRGEPQTPIPAPDLGGREWLFLAGFAGTLVFLSSLAPQVGGLGSLWPVFAQAGAP